MVNWPEMLPDPERMWEHEGICCAIVKNHAGSWNGYCCIPEGHPWRAYTNHDDIPLDVHGGITFGPYHVPEMEFEMDGEVRKFEARTTTWEDVQYWIGFDTIHGFDLYETAEGKILDIRSITRENLLGGMRSKWKKEEVIAETERMAAQIAQAAGDRHVRVIRKKAEGA